MKMKKYFLYIAATAMLALACQKIDKTPAKSETDPSTPAVEMISETVSGSRAVATKATISDADASFAWTAGDNVAVHISNGEYVYTSDEGAAGATIGESEDIASFTVVYEKGYERDAFALYPSTIVAKDAANYGQEGHSLDVTLPGSYTLAELSGETSPCPMIAGNLSGEGWDFYQLCGLLRLKVNGVPATAKRLEIKFDGKKVCGDFSIASPEPGTAAIESADDAANDCITVTKDGTDATLGAANLVLNIPLPAGGYTEFTITAYDTLSDGNAIVSITRPFAFTSTNKKAVKRTATFPSALTAFRGYEVSAGILERDGSTSPATYSLTSGAMILTADPDGRNEHYALPDGCNPFEPAVYYGNNDNKGKYFNLWLTLKSELGAALNSDNTPSNHIDPKSDKLPSGWQFPTGGNNTTSDWGKIIFGAPKSPITVNGTTVSSNAYVKVLVTLESGNSYSVAAGNYYGMFLLRDGATIPAGLITKIGPATYSDNQITETQFNELIKLGCLFISATGYYSDKFGSWRDLSASWQYGDYWSSTYRSNNQFYYLNFYNYNNNKPSVTTSSSDGHQNYQVVKLVKPM